MARRRCEVCDRRVVYALACGPTPYRTVTPPGWQWVCRNEPCGGWYWIDRGRLLTHEAIRDWLRHLGEKDWFDRDDFLRALCRDSAIKEVIFAMHGNESLPARRAK